MDSRSTGAPRRDDTLETHSVARLREQLQSYRLLVDRAADMINRVSRRGVYIYVSPASAQLFGYTPDEMLGRSIFDFVHPSDMEHIQLDRLSEETAGEPTPVEYRRAHKDGHYVWAETVIRAVIDPETGNLIEFVTTTRDITERRIAEQESERVRHRLESIYDHIDARLWITEVRDDGSFVWVYNNPADREMTGVDLTKPGGVLFEEALPPESAEYNRRRCQEVIDTGKTVTYDDFFDVEGERRCSWNTLIPVRDPSGRIREIIGTGIDVTERRDVARSVLGAIEREQRRIGQDLHDGLLQQLTGIMFMVQLHERHLRGERQELAREAREIGELLTESVSQARNLSHGLFPAEVEKEGLVAALTQLAESTVERCELPCFFEYERNGANGNGMLHALDLETETHIFRIAQESVSNAVRHAQATQIEIVLHDGAESLQMCVQDDGKGFCENQPTSGGMGLRSMAYRSNLIGAEFSVYSRKPGRGTVVCCRLRRSIEHSTRNDENSANNRRRSCPLNHTGQE